MLVGRHAGHCRACRASRSQLYDVSARDPVVSQRPRSRCSGVHPHQAGIAMNALVVGGVAVSALARTDGGRASTAACETHSTR